MDKGKPPVSEERLDWLQNLLLEKLHAKDLAETAGGHGYPKARHYMLERCDDDAWRWLTLAVQRICRCGWLV